MISILGDTNYNLLDRKGKFILKKGYRFSSDESNYTTPLYLTKKYVELIRTFGLTQLIDEPTRTSDRTSTLLDHILVTKSLVNRNFINMSMTIPIDDYMNGYNIYEAYISDNRQFNHFFFDEHDKTCTCYSVWEIS